MAGPFDEWTGTSEDATPSPDAEPLADDIALPAVVPIEPTADAEHDVESDVLPAEAPLAVVADLEPDDADEPAANVDFEIPALVLSEVPSPDDDVPDEVSNAVLRAIRAIESASTTAPTVAAIAEPEPPAPEPEPAVMGFAPPTLEMSAEAIYARQAAEMAAAEVDEPAASDHDQPRVASVVFVDDAAGNDEPEPESRAGALRRLIDSIRKR